MNISQLNAAKRAARAQARAIPLGGLLGPGMLVMVVAGTQPADPVLYLVLYVGMLVLGLLLAGAVGWRESRRARRSRAGNDTPVSRP